MCEPECRGGGEDVATYVNFATVTTVERLQLHSDEHLGEQRRAWRRLCLAGMVIPGPSETTLGYTVRLRDLQSTTWYLHKIWLRTKNNFLLVVKIEGKDLRAKKDERLGVLDSKI